VSKAAISTRGGKLPGVEQLRDFVVQIRVKMMILPGEQFVIRRLGGVPYRKTTFTLYQWLRLTNRPENAGKHQ
jgi:hypothetical protein